MNLAAFAIAGAVAREGVTCARPAAQPEGGGWPKCVLQRGHTPQALFNKPERSLMFARSALALALVAAASLAHADAKVLKKVAPDYPGEAVKKNITAGSVRAKIAIAGDGKVSGVDIVEAEPKRVFDRAAVDALSQWKFEGTGAPQTHEVKLVFKSED
jgi:protein TonB